MPSDVRRRADSQLAQRAARGDESAWCDLVERYSGLIFALIGRYLGDPDEDERRDTFVDVLETLRDGALARYDGRCRLSTWLGVVARSRSLDRYRCRHGRRQTPRWLSEMSEREQAVYRLYYVEGLGYSEVCDRMSGNEPGFSVEELVECLERIDEHMDPRVRRRLAYDLQARTTGAMSGRVLEYQAEMRIRLSEDDSVLSPERPLLEEEEQARLDALRRAIRTLDEEEAEALRYRFHHGLTAREIARRMGVRSPRRAYTIIDRAVRKLRRALVAEEA